MNKLFYPKLAFSGILKNRRFYFPYLLTCVLMISGFYIMCSLAENDGVDQMKGSDALQTILYMGCFVIGLFAVIFLFYTNSFLMKRRSKELGLYHVLGMGKRHIAKMLFFETLYTAGFSLTAGLGTGILLDKLMTLALYRLLSFEVPFGFSVTGAGILRTVILFSAVFLLNLATNLLRIARSDTVKLIYGGNTGEKEPRANWLLALLGVLLTGTGYVIAQTTENPIQALALYFVAVVCVILGTYLLFTSVSIAVLKLLRKSKRFYYQPRHFTAVSGMLYRMKQNAVGLANICILSTMVLVMISSTVSLFCGIDDVVKAQYPRDVTVLVRKSSTGCDRESVVNAIAGQVKKYGLQMQNVSDIRYCSFAAGRIGDGFVLDNSETSAEISMLYFCSLSEYRRVTGDKAALAGDEMLVFYPENVKKAGRLAVGDRSYRTVELAECFMLHENNPGYSVPVYYLVLNDAELDTVIALQDAAYGEDASYRQYELYFDLTGNSAEKRECIAHMTDGITATFESLTIRDRLEGYDFVYSMYGGFLFLGLFLGFIFTLAAALIIYYKQISEGYEDKQRFEIMQKVGMSRSEVKHTINAQVLMVFFLPIAVAAIHLLFHFKIMTKLLALMYLTNTNLFLLCSLVTIGVFFLLYGAVYLLTSRIYYRIVSR